MWRRLREDGGLCRDGGREDGAERRLSMGGVGVLEAGTIRHSLPAALSR